MQSERLERTLTIYITSESYRGIKARKLASKKKGCVRIVAFGSEAALIFGPDMRHSMRGPPWRGLRFDISAESCDAIVALQSSGRAKRRRSL